MCSHMPARPRRSVLALAVCAALQAQMAAAEQDRVAVAAIDPIGLPTVVITASRQAQRAFDVPAAISVVDTQALATAGPQVNLSEVLNRVPGISVNNRQNYAQDLQVTSRGFGARSAFGVRGVRLYADGIPATMPDGQGQAASFDLGSAARIEALRGPFSAQYGNASGGVVQVFTEDGPPRPEGSAGLWLGSDGLRKWAVKTGGTSGAVNYVFDLTRFSTDGYRDHSAAQRMQFNGKLRWRMGSGESLTAVVNTLRMPGVQDPLGLKRAQFDADPQQPGDNALAYNTRKDIDQSQLGLVYLKRLGSDELRLMAYQGQRAVLQYLAIPRAQQIGANADTTPGGVIGLSRRYRGVDARYVLRSQLLEQPLHVTAGLAMDQMLEHRTGYLNFLDASTLGVQGAIKRDEDNRAANADPYIQAQWWPSGRLSLTAGVRHSSVRIDSQDHYIATGNGDDSGSTHFRADTPVLGAVFSVSDALKLYANTGHSFETPTLNELAYRTGGTAGLNTAINASRGKHLELGSKYAPRAGTGLNAALFDVHTDDEIAVASSSGGRSVYQNVGRTRRTGLELDGQMQWGGSSGKSWTLYGAYTRIDAVYDDRFSTSAGATVAAGKRLPGVAANQTYIELAWQPLPGLQTALEWRHVGKVFVNDLNDDAAPAYATLAWRAGWTQELRGLKLSEFIRVDNLQDRRYAGSVIVNESNQRYFEPAPGRSWVLGVKAVVSF